MTYVMRVVSWLSGSERLGFTLMRIAIAVVFLCIGALKFFPYEADSITPFVANSRLLSEFYAHLDEYKQHLTREGELVPEKRTWQINNHTYGFSDGLGIVEVAIGLLVLAAFVTLRIGTIGALLAFLTPFVTLSFLVIPPEAWVPALRDGNHGFPYLSGAGRLVLKDVMLLAGGFLILGDSVRALQAKYSTYGQ